MINLEDDIFKYCSLDIGELIISSQLLKFNNPKFFNDPFDCDIDLLKFDLSDISEQVNGELQLLKNNLKRNLGPSYINDIDELNNQNYQEFYKQAQIDKVNRSSICCFSKTYNNTTMWSHYGNNHTGVCLAFDPYSKNPFIHRKPMTKGPVDYPDNYKIVNYLKSKEDGIKNLFFSKSKDWKYENEYRYISFEEHGLFKFEPAFLSGVIFGQRTKAEQILRIKNVCERYGYEGLSFAKMTKNNLELKFEIID